MAIGSFSPTARLLPRHDFQQKKTESLEPASILSSNIEERQSGEGIHIEGVRY